MKASNLATDVVSWQYIATPSGIARTYPANRQEVCYDYDPRVRPWYVAATSGPKDVVIVIDKSGSMTIEDRIGLTIDAVKSVLVTLSANDFVAVVVFDDVGQQLCDDTTGLKCGMLSQATSVNKDVQCSYLFSDRLLHSRMLFETVIRSHPCWLEAQRPTCV
jgi:hypothetical protein